MITRCSRAGFIALTLLLAVSALGAAPEDHVAAGRSYLNAGRDADAKAEFTAAMQQYHAKGDFHGEAVSLLLVGISDVSLGNVDAARGELQRAARMLDAQQDYLGAWIGLLTLAELEKGLGRYTAAFSFVDDARATLEKAKTSTAPFTLATFFTIAAQSEMPAEFMAFVTSNPQMAEMLKPTLFRFFAEPITHDAAGGVFLETGQLERAEEELKAAVSGAQLIGALYESSFGVHLGDVLYRKRDLAGARARYEKALRKGITLGPWSLGSQRPEIRILSRLVDLDMDKGDIDGALRWNDMAIDMARKAGNRKREAALLNDRGHALGRGARYLEAETALADARTIANEIQDIHLQASIEANVGGVNMLRGTYGTSISHLEASVALYETLNDPIVAAPVWTNLAILYLLTSSDSSAEQVLNRARQLAETSQYDLACEVVRLAESWLQFQKGEISEPALEAAFENFARNPEAQSVGFSDDLKRLLQMTVRVGAGGHPSGAIPGIGTAKLPFVEVSSLAHFIEGRRLLIQGNVAAAREVWRKALAINSNPDMRVGLQALIGVTYWKEGDIDQAIHWLSEAAKTLEIVMGDLKADALLASYLGSDRRAYYDILIETLIRSGRVETAFDVTERARARSFLHLVGNHRIQQPPGAQSDLAREAEELRVLIAKTERQATAGDRLAKARERYQSLSTRIQAAGSEYASLTNVEPLELDALRKELPANTTLISYFLTGAGAHAWILDASRLEHVALPLDNAKLQRIACWTQQLTAGRTRGARPVECGTDPATAEEAYGQLIAPLRPLIRNSRLLIVPHGALHYVPFAALHDPVSNRSLIDDYAIFYAPSVSSLRFLRAKETPIEGRALVLGDPAAPAQFALPGAKREAERVAHRFHTTARVGKNARESLLYDLHGKVDLVHLAAHGYYDSAAPLFSFIALAEGDGKDGRLEVDEILSSVDLTGVNLVVLSACRSGIGKRSGGDDIVGLTRSLLYAGTPGVISTLWDIDDRATALLMETFYERLLEGIPAAEALRNAQLDLRKNPQYSDSRFWGAFFLTGDPAGRWLQR